MKFDLHTHHERCGHALGTIEDYIKSAVEKGLNFIGISDHTPYFHSEVDHLHPGIAMPKSELSSYVAEVVHLKEKYRGKIDVLLGIESDFFPNHINAYQLELIKHPFDYVIGSVHFVEEVSIFKKGRWDHLSEKEKIHLKDRYFKLIEQSAKSGAFQILGHIDAMKGFYPQFSDVKATYTDSMLKTIGELGVAIEVNTSGKTKDCGGWYPGYDLLERALHYQVDITFGSDAHKPERIGDDFDEVQKALRDIGFKQMVYFKEKEKHVVSL